MSLPLVLEIYMQLMSETITFDLLIDTVSLALKNCDVLNKDTIFKKMFEGKEEEEW